MAHNIQMIFGCMIFTVDPTKLVLNAPVAPCLVLKESLRRRVKKGPQWMGDKEREEASDMALKGK